MEQRRQSASALSSPSPKFPLLAREGSSRFLRAQVTLRCRHGTMADVLLLSEHVPAPMSIPDIS
eukprot:768517-Hanusia_phi.AAC.4